LPSIVTGAAPRLYVYSQSDPLVLATRVEQHIATAAQLGLDVAIEEFEGTGHAAHMHSDPERYWTAVHSMWMGAVARLSTDLPLAVAKNHL
jgi:alpha-beta hydrolase superfamily lysophospholipase